MFLKKFSSSSTEFAEVEGERRPNDSLSFELGRAGREGEKQAVISGQKVEIDT